MGRDEISENLWKWRYKLQNIGKSGEKTLSDFSSAEVAKADEFDDTAKARSKTNKASKNPLASSVPSKNAELGSSVSVKTLYEGPNSHDDFYDWVDYPPKQLSKSAAKAQDRVAIKVFKVKDTDKPVISGRSSLRYHMVEIQNPLLLAALGDILKKQDVHLEANENASFQHPFTKLYFGYLDILAAYRALGNDDASNALRPFLLLLIRLLDDIFADTRAKLEQLRASGLVSYKLAWAFFPRNTTVIAWGNNCELLCKVTDTTYNCAGIMKFLQIEGKVLRFNGRGFQWEDYQIKLPEFSGNKLITQLPAYPLEFHEGADEVKARLTARGRKVLDYQGLAYVNYTGIAMHQDGKDMQKHNVDGRVLIDVVGFNKHHLALGSREGGDPETQKQQLPVLGDGDHDSDDEDEDHTARNLATDAASGGTSAKKSMTKRIGQAAQRRNRETLLACEAKEPHFMYMLPLIEGYALINKLWVAFYVEDISPVVWNDQAYDHLVYDEQQKDLVMSFVENHGAVAAQRRSKAMQDVIAGKGEGLIILLSGPPGTGKTLMAEAVADRTHRPLFYLQAEDLGTNPAILGANIKRVFEMATEWNAVILLDEADVFMAERHPSDITRNELVSIFLRELEYYRGIIFLTTNLYSTIDSAFRSRVSLHLLFNSLTPEARTIVWRKFLDRLPPPVAMPGKSLSVGADDEGPPAAVELSEGDVKELSAWQLNGREIKTAVKMVRTWCDHKGYDMTLSRLENGIKVTSPHASKSTSDNDTSLYDD
ncbi:P-loop containing nucleoside triphosphate hydrolase protein [Lasiosphaeria ovina]|uniref:P-loop containing nucleoside triphosphate hydrolase protein n=1 Tax=Lasiosphaeria ovina TaxID=92902 RepID=A0AAE0KAC5_9PEZI|nr:P-loop containing nucleoside triphosphate hydrolase protein [Lasiosphaeria ovina]